MEASVRRQLKVFQSIQIILGFIFSLLSLPVLFAISSVYLEFKREDSLFEKALMHNARIMRSARHATLAIEEGMLAVQKAFLVEEKSGADLILQYQDRLKNMPKRFNELVVGFDPSRSARAYHTDVVVTEGEEEWYKEYVSQSILKELNQEVNEAEAYFRTFFKQTNLTFQQLQKGILWSQQGQATLAAKNRADALVSFQQAQEYKAKVIETLGKMVEQTSLAADSIRESTEKKRNNRIIVFALFSITLFMVVYLISWVISRRLLIRPIKRIAQANFAVSRGDKAGECIPDSEIPDNEIGHMMRARNKMVNSLSQAKKYIDNILESMVTMLIVFTADGTVRTVNKASCSSLEYEKLELIGKSIGEIIVEDRDAVEATLTLNEFFQNEKIANLERHYITKSGQIIPVSLSGSVMRTEDGGIQGVVCLAQDISDRLAAEEALRKHKDHLEDLIEERTHDLSKAKEEAEVAREEAIAANNTKSEFLANFSHELRTPMHGILSYAKFGIKKINTVTNDKLLSYFQEIFDSGNRLMVLLNDILDLSKLEANKMSYDIKQCDLMPVIEIIKSEFSAMASEKKLVFEVLESNAESLTAFFDKIRVQQVLRNLVSNAIKFSDPDAKIVIGAERFCENNTDFIKASVSNKGVGIPPDELDKVFDKFVQSSKTKTGAGGTGLGLPISQRIIEDTGGRIWVESELYAFTTFYFTLPVHERAAQSID